MKDSICGYAQCPRHKGKPCRRCERMVQRLHAQALARELKKKETK